MSEETETTKDSIRKRIEDHLAFLTREHPEVFINQKHCDAGTPERAYWHHGYMMALRDIEKQMEKGLCQTKQ